MGSAGRVARWGVAALVLAAAGGGLWWARPWLFPDPLARGAAAYRRGDWAGAAEGARRALKDRPGDREGLRLLARASGRLGRHEAAQAIYNRPELGVEALEVEDQVVVATGLSGRGKNDQARVVLELAQAKEPDHPEVMHEWGRLLAAKDRLAEAAELAGRLARRPGWEARGSVMLGLLLKEQADPAGAAEALGRALEVDCCAAAGRPRRRGTCAGCSTRGPTGRRRGC
jgi:Flp pilus assembly protein TadD